METVFRLMTVLDLGVGLKELSRRNSSEVDGGVLGWTGVVNSTFSVGAVQNAGFVSWGIGGVPTGPGATKLC